MFTLNMPFSPILYIYRSRIPLLLLLWTQNCFICFAKSVNPFRRKRWTFSLTIYHMWNTFIPHLLAVLVLLKYKIWKVCCAVAQYYEFGCQTPDSPSIFIKNIKPDNDHYLISTRWTKNIKNYQIAVWTQS
jgi:hypothetical protein